MNKLLHFKKVVLVLLLLVGALNVYSQHVVTGKVIDEQGPLIGASVTIKDAAVPTGTVTDADGRRAYLYSKRSARKGDKDRR